MVEQVSVQDHSSTDESDSSFDRFAGHKFYATLNRWLVERVDSRPRQVVVDLACGVGIVTRLIHENLRLQGILIIAIDDSKDALRQAEQELHQSTDISGPQFVRARVEDVSRLLPQKVDTVFMCNAIHLVADKAHLLKEVQSVLRPGGTFAFNSAFFGGANPSDLGLYYRRWVLRAHRILRSEYGLVTKRARRVEARKQLSRHQYEKIVEEHGFRLKRSKVHEIEIPLEAWLDICSYKDFIAGALGDVPLEQASASLRQAAREVFHEIEPKRLCRNWLQIVAVRSG